MKKALLIVGIVVIVGLAAAGGFYAGSQYQTNKVDQARTNFENMRGQFNQGQFPGEGAGFQNPGGSTNGGAPGFRGGTNGQIKSIDGNVLTISTAQDVTKVNLSDSTQIQRTTVVVGSIAELQPGMRVLIIGPKDSKGTVSAGQIMILNENPANAAGPSATKKAP